MKGMVTVYVDKFYSAVLFLNIKLINKTESENSGGFRGRAKGAQAPLFGGIFAKDL